MPVKKIWSVITDERVFRFIVLLSIAFFVSTQWEVVGRLRRLQSNIHHYETLPLHEKLNEQTKMLRDIHENVLN